MEFMETLKYVIFFAIFALVVFGLIGTVLFAGVYQVVRDELNKARRRNPSLPKPNGWAYLWAFERAIGALLSARK